MAGPLPGSERDAEVLAGHLADYGELLDLLAERPGLVVVATDPLSGATDLLATAAESLDGIFVTCDARSCFDSVDLAMSIADAAVAVLAPEAEAWWMGSAPPASTSGLQLWRALSARGIDPIDLQHGGGKGLHRLSDAIELIAALDDEASLVIDHLGLMLSAMHPAEARDLLGELRAVHQQHPGLDLVLVEHAQGLMSKALADRRHPMFQAGQLVRIHRPSPDRFAGDLAVARAWTDVPVETLRGAAELTRGVPALTWRVVELSGRAGVQKGWQRLRHATEAVTASKWDLLRQVHPQAQPVVGAMGAGLRPHSVAANAKSINDALNRLRGLGAVWQPEERRWSLSDPLLASWVRAHAPPWAVHGRRSGSLEPESF